MLERSAEIDDLAGRIFLAEHFCSRTIQAPEASEPVGEVRVWMELNDFDQAPIGGDVLAGGGHGMGCQLQPCFRCKGVYGSDHVRTTEALNRPRRLSSAWKRPARP